MNHRPEDSEESELYFSKLDTEGDMMHCDASHQSREDRYKIGVEVGKGGQGRVFSCQDTTLGRIVALKEPREVRGWSRLQREVMIAAKLSHPNIVPVYDITTVDGKPCSVMKLVGNQTLTEAIEEYHRTALNPVQQTSGSSAKEREEKPVWTLTDLLRILKEACNAIAYAHSQKVLHRDLKPQNISLGEYGETIVLDWGLACSIDDIQNSQFSHKSGSSGYCSPEQLRGDSSKIGYATDVYSLGAILFKILTNTTGLEAQGGVVTEEAFDRRIISPIALRPTVPADLDAICRKALQWEPGDRYASVIDFARDLDRFAQDLPVSVRKPNWKDKLRRFSKVHYAGLLSTATAALIAALAAGVIISLVLFKDKQITAAKDDMATALTVADNTLRGFESQGMSYYAIADAASGRMDKNGFSSRIDSALPLYKGLLRLKERKSEEAVPLFREALENDDSRHAARFFLSLALGNTRNYDEALSTGLTLAEMEPENVYSQQHVADLFLINALAQEDKAKRGELLKKAEEYALHAHALDSSYDQVVILLGEIKQAIGDLDEASDFMRKAVELNPDFSNRQRLMDLLQEQGRNEEAYEISKELVEAKSESQVIYLQHAQILRSLGKLAQSLEYFKRFDDLQAQLPLEKRKDTSYYNDWGVTLAAQRRFDEALAVYEKGMPEFSGNPVFESNVAYSMLGTGKTNDCVAKMMKVFEVDRSPGTFCLMLQAIIASSDFQQAVDMESATPSFESGAEKRFIFVRSALAYIACRLADRPLTPAAKQWEELSQSPAIEKETWDYYYLEQWLSKLPESQRGEAEATIQKLSSIVAPRYSVAK